ncbi:GNAT family N-acetyltransferase [Alkalihalobacillus sp. AL-G]|uniref:GNAT family N-acetyltransferase n=1 Tax=Alkalihalobacillus sp. AL-G TaxID=2926399 RepID=UPI00272C1B52|nr:GNAT family N-acetyltransferase [Alkalihalobacillus sp. AL-G]WLD92441.1 GNAT family N-acetyltransferase [Alkalihalobacillus sp. AL-G]
MGDSKQFDEYTLSTDRSHLDIPYIHHYLSKHSYWAKGIDLETVETSINHSLCFGVYRSGEDNNLKQQVGFARIVTDYVTFAYLADVFIDEAHRGKGLSKWLLKEILDHPGLQRLRSFLLMTKDAQGLYEQFGFKTFNNDEKRLMAIRQKAEELYT